MRKKIISCLLSVTLILNSVLPYASAYAVEVPEGEAVTESVETVESEQLETEVSEGVSEDGLESDISSTGDSGGILSDSGSGVLLGLPSPGEGAEEGAGEEGAKGEREVVTLVELPEPTPGDAYPSYNPNSRALPAVVAWLSAIGVGAKAVSAIRDLINGGASSDEETLLYGILSALVDDGGVIDYINYLETYMYNASVHAGNIYNHMLYDGYPLGAYLYWIEIYTKNASVHAGGILDALKYDGYAVSEMLYWIEAYSKNSSIYLSDLKGYLDYVEPYLFNISEHLADIKGYTDYLESYSSNISEHLADIKGVLSEHGDILIAIRDGIKNIGSPEVEIPEIEVEVKTDKEADLSDSFNLWELLFGALEFGLIATSISDLGDTMQTTFPFSLVAGFVAIIGLLQAEPVAPSFDFPMPDGVGGTVEYTVDLAPFDDVAAAFRVLITIVFILGLIGITRNFIFKGGSSE